MDEKEYYLFNMFFASIVSMAHCHPGTSRENTQPLSLEECAAKAYSMLEISRVYKNV